MDILFNKEVVQSLSGFNGRYKDKEIVVAIDSSKTNTAICIMSKNYKVLDLVEFGGSKEKDVFILARDTRQELRSLLAGAKVIDGGIEDVITTERDNKSSHMNFHHARLVLTAVYVSLIVFFQDEFGITLKLIPNQTWKRRILAPANLNKRTIYKGSVEYCRTKYPKYVIGDKPDDGTDAICIGEYLCILAGHTDMAAIQEIPDDIELCKYSAAWRLHPADIKVTAGRGIEFMYNDKLTLEANAHMIANRIPEDKYGYAILHTTSLNIQDIYKYACTKDNWSLETDKLLLEVRRVKDVENNK